MKHLYLLLVSTVVTTYSLAQTEVLTSGEMPPVGSTLTLTVADNVSIVDTATGSGAMWDHSTFVPSTQPSWDVEFMLPSSSPYPTAFPSSNYCLYESSIPRYNYYDLNSNVLEKVGSWSTGQNTYTDGQIELTFPVQLGTTYTDTWDNTNSSFGGTYSSTCIGSGTLLLPGGIYNDVLLLRVVLEELFPITLYEWYDATNGARLMLYYPPSPPFVVENAVYLSNFSIGIEEVGHSIDLRIQSIIASELQVSYSSTEAVQLSIISTNGKRLAYENLAASRSPITRSINVEHLVRGLYIVNMRSADGQQRSGRFVKH